MRRRVAILGVTGSIGRAALDVARALPERIEVAAVTAHSDEDGLAAIRREFPGAAAALTSREPGALVEFARREDVDVVLLAVVGAAGAEAALAAAGAGKTIALANKEALVMAGPVLVPLARASGAQILPVDSEHSAIFQCLRAGRRAEVARVVLTASGGPFRTWPKEKMAAATLADALDHPTWDMGQKVTIDSATMMNKALELLEAAWLFDLRADELGVVVHPQSVVHSLVEYVDGSVIAQHSPPDMRLPIQLALALGDRLPGPAARTDWSASQTLTFEPPDHDRFPAIGLAFEAIRRGGSAGAVLNAANEIAVEAFVAGRTGVTGIADTVSAIMRLHAEGRLEGVVDRPAGWPDLQRADAAARAAAARVIDGSQGL